MKLLERKLTSGDYWRCAEEDFDLCNMGIRSLFDFPEECEEIWISIHDVPQDNRVKCLVPNEYDDFPALFVNDKSLLHNGGKSFAHPFLDDLLADYIGENLYIQLEY